MKIYHYSFERLEVWKLSRNLVTEIYRLTAQYPKAETFGIISQIQRATISISANLAEGSARISYKEKARFTEIAYGSLLELLSLLIISLDLKYITENDLLDYRKKIELVSNKLNSLRSYQLSKSVSIHDSASV